MSGHPENCQTEHIASVGPDLQTQHLQAVSSAQRTVEPEEVSRDSDQHVNFMDGKTEVLHAWQCHPSSVPGFKRGKSCPGELADDQVSPVSEWVSCLPPAQSEFRNLSTVKRQTTAEGRRKRPKHSQSCPMTTSLLLERALLDPAAGHPLALVRNTDAWAPSRPPESESAF